MGEDIRRRVVASFRNAIDFEQNNNDLEAYRKYLDGVALVAAALQQDADCTWVAGKPNLSEKERKSLLGFAKQSVDRLIFLLEKEDQNKCSIFQNFTTTSTAAVAAADSGYKQVGNVANSGTVPANISQSNSRKPEAPVTHYVVPSPHVEEPDENDISPIERMRKENHLLMTRYAARLQAATSKTVRHNLQLELERRLMENSAIAQQQQEAWDKQRSKVTEWCLQVAEEKFRIKERIQCGTITEADFKKQRIFAAALKYEEEHLWLKRLKQDLLLFPKDEERQRDIVAHVLNDKIHPLGNLMGQMQHAILNKVSPLIRSKQESSNSSHSNINKRKDRGVSSTVEELSLVFNQPQEQALSSSPVNEEIEQEERKAFQRHFSNIADDIKEDVKLLETLLYTLYEPLASEPGSNILTELLHEMYFPPLKSSLISLIRLGITDLEIGLTDRMAVQRENPEVTDLDEEILRSSCHAMHRITCLSSPCQMLDSLTALMKCLATSDDAQMKSIGADDLLPRLMSVVMSSGMPSLLAEALYMETFMPVNRALGEAGYCLTVLQSVMTCVQIPTG